MRPFNVLVAFGALSRPTMPAVFAVTGTCVIGASFMTRYIQKRMN